MGLSEGLTRKIKDRFEDQRRKRRVWQKRQKQKAHRGPTIRVEFNMGSARMMAFWQAVEIASISRRVKPGFLFAQLAYAALSQWGELPENAIGCLDEYYRDKRRWPLYAPEKDKPVEIETADREDDHSPDGGE